MEWLVIGIGIVVGVLILAVIVRSRQGPYSPGMEATGGLAAFGATMAATQDEDKPTSPDEDALDEHGADDAGADDADGAGNGGGDGGGEGGGDGGGDGSGD